MIDFKNEFNNKCGDEGVDSQTQSIEEIWERLKRNLINAAESVCGQTKE